MNERVEQLLEQRRAIDAELAQMGITIVNGEPTMQLQQNHGPANLYEVMEKGKAAERQITIDHLAMALNMRPPGWRNMLDEGLKKLR